MDVESVVQDLPLSDVDLDAPSEEPASKSNAVIEMASPSAEISSYGKSKNISDSKMNVDCSGGVVVHATQSSDVHQRVSADCDLLEMLEDNAVHASERGERSQRRCQTVGDSGDNVDSATEVEISELLLNPSIRQEVEKCQSPSLSATECAPGAGEILAMSSSSPGSCAAVSIEFSAIEPANSFVKKEAVDDDTEVGTELPAEAVDSSPCLSESKG
ncbi:hypothetical protein Aperf_G00000077761 [Anoplocephala perfoliata]